jgi:hypothetical protein
MMNMKTNQNTFHALAVVLLATVFLLPAQAADRIERGEMAGYLLNMTT